MPNQSVIVLDFGGQYNQLIARRVRECNVYCEVKPNTMTVDEIRAFDPIGIIFTGGPQSVYAEGSPQVDPEIFRLGIPILGICYGCQLMAQYLGGEVTAAGKDTAREYGKTQTWFDTDCRLFRGLPEQSITWMSHGDYMAKVPESFRLVAHSDACPTVGICDEARGFYGVQFHPEVNHTEYGRAMLRNFLYEVCGAKGQWTMGDYKDVAIRQIREKVGDGKVLLALSGGVDSSVVAALLIRAIGKQLTCVHVNHGLLRKGEPEQVVQVFRDEMDANLIYVDAVDRFLERTKFQSHALVFLRKPVCFLELRVIEELERFLPLQHALKPQSGVIAFGIKADLVILIRLVSESLNDADRFAGDHFDSETLPAVRRVARIDSGGGGVIDPIASRPLFKRRVDESGSAIERNTGKYGKTR